ncbi:MAG: hypothetical protein JW909_04345 [Planctomycetes bacterium]|nr:hypothetical protein [Planctomycetota bacterium]
MSNPEYIIYIPTGMSIAGGQHGPGVLVWNGRENFIPLIKGRVRNIASTITGLCSGETVYGFDLPPRLARILFRRGMRVRDTCEIARILFPQADEFSAGGIAEYLGLEWPGQDMVASAGAIVEACDGAVDAMPLVAVEMVYNLLNSAGEGSAEYFDFAAKRLTARGRSGPAGGLQEYKALFGSRVARYASPPEDPGAAAYLEPGTVRDFFAPDGPLASVLPQYEDRPGQVSMAVLVAEAMNKGSRLLVEAGTGVGKSLAYLLPAVTFSLSSGRRVVVATNTKTLQNQLINKDMVVLAKALEMPFRTAMLKGRRNYLCLRKFFRLLQRGIGGAGEETASAVACLIPWSLVTGTGDISGNTAFLSRASSEDWLGLASTHEDCMGRQCRWYRSCFLRRARAAAHGANVVVVNYALLMSGLEEDSDIIPPFEDVVLDEAHNIENAATDAFSIVAARWKTRRFLKNIAGGSDGGLVGAMGDLIRASGLGEELTKVVGRLLNEASSHYSIADTAQKNFFDTAAGMVEQSGVEKLRYDGATRNPDVFAPLVEAKKDLVAALAGMAQPLKKVLDLVGPHAGGRGLFAGDAEHARTGGSGWLEIMSELSGHLDMVAELIHDVDFVVSASEKGYVYWIEKTGGTAEVWATPVDVSGMLYENLYLRKRSVVFTSATLTVSGRLDFFMRRTGAAYLEEPETHVVPSPFDYRTQAQLLIPTYLPEPMDPDFTEAFARLIGGAVEASDGRAMILFTSHRMLSGVTDMLRTDLLEAGYEVLQQEVDGPRDALLGRFRRNLKSVLFGTASFWEGIDVKGESLSMLILAKLPFPVHRDPLIAARQEFEEGRGNDPFNGYLLPLAVLRLRQGFGRLVRSRHDRGIVIVADKRLISRRYGGAFLSSLPAPYRPVASPAEMQSITSGFFRNARYAGDTEIVYEDHADVDPYDIWGV